MVVAQTKGKGGPVARHHGHCLKLPQKNSSGRRCSGELEGYDKKNWSSGASLNGTELLLVGETSMPFSDLECGWSHATRLRWR